MFHEKPRPSAELILAGLIAWVAAYAVLRWLAPALVDAGLLGEILAVVGAICLLSGLWRFFTAFDDVAFHLWQKRRAGDDAGR